MSYGIGGAGSVPEAGTFVAPVPGTRIYLKRSEIKGKQPVYDDAEYGELFVNYHSEDPMLCFKDNGGNIVALKPAGPIGNGPIPPLSDNETGDLWWDGNNLLVWNGSSWEVVGEQALGDLTDVDTTGQADGMVLAYDGSEWVPVSPASLAVDVDLDYTPASDKGTVNNTAGDDAVIPLVENTAGGNAGLMSADDKVKLDTLNIDANGDITNVKVDLDYTAAADKGTVTNTGGTDAVIPLANGTTAGLSLHNYSQDDKDKVDAIPAGGVPEVLGDLNDVDTTGEADGHVLAYDGSEWVPVNPASLSVDVDLDYTPAADKGTVTNTAGDDAEIPFATSAQAGLFQEAPTPDSGSVQYAREVDDAGDASWAPVEIPPGTIVDDGTGLPDSPENGQLWFNTDDGRLYVYFEDVDGTKQWVDASPESATPDLEWDNIQNKPDNLGLWEVNGSDLEPVDNTNNVKIGGGDISLNNDGSAEFAGDINTGATAGPVTSIELKESSKKVTFKAGDGNNYWAASFGSYNSNSAYIDAHTQIICRGGALNGNLAGVGLDAGATAWANLSDERAKTNLSPITDGLTKVGSLRAVTGRYKTDNEDVSRAMLIAQDVQAVLPEAVNASNPDELHLRITEVIPLLVSALHDAKERIETLEAEVASLKGGN